MITLTDYQKRLKSKIEEAVKRTKLTDLLGDKFVEKRKHKKNVEDIQEHIQAEAKD